MTETTKSPKFVYARAIGKTIEAMRDDVRKTEVYRRGDTVLVWINEGDLIALEMTGQAQRVSAA